MRRTARLTIAVVSVTALLAGCAPAMISDPHIATDEDPGIAEAPTTEAPPGPAPIEVPQNELSWRDCSSQQFQAAGLPVAPGITLECASFDADLDSINGANGTISVGVVRATSQDTPADAGPLVFTTGTDLPSSSQLAVWLSRSGADLLQSRPIVAIDRRGIGLSGDISCRDNFDQQEMASQTQFVSGNDPVASLGAVTVNATTSCTDTIAPGDSAYDNAHAAEDIEELRSIWEVPSLALLGIGNGAQVALAYAGSHPAKVARLVLDSPLPLGIGAEAAVEQRVKGQQAALDTFLTQCSSTADCPLGADPRATVDALFADVRAGDGPGDISVAELANAISTALGFPSGDRMSTTRELAEALATARTGNANLLTALVNRAEAMRDTDGQFVNNCSDSLNRPTPDRVRELVVQWGKVYPQFGSVGALDLVKCLNWPSGSPAKDPEGLTIDMMLLGVQTDPIVGHEGVAAVAATAINAGSASRRVMWQGMGHGAMVYTQCALPPVIGYLDTGLLPETDTYCPA